jgi:hypothetical protein
MWARRGVAFAVAATLGFVAVVLPPLLDGEVPEGVMDAVSLGVEKANWITGLVLVAAGFVGGLLWRGSSWLPAVATTCWLPFWSILDASTSSIERHNLLPFEWLGYALGALLGFLGAELARRTLEGREST